MRPALLMVEQMEKAKPNNKGEGEMPQEGRNPWPKVKN